MPLLLASLQSQLTVFAVVMVFGLAVGILGHLAGSRTLILTGILVIGLASALFLVIEPGSVK